MESKNIIIVLLLSTLSFFTSCKTNFNQDKKLIDNSNLITIKGRVIVQGTNSAPQGLTSINIKNKWAWKDESINAYGENEKVFANRRGYYKIKIEKGDTLVFIPNHIIYGRHSKDYTYIGLNKSQILNITIKEDKENYDSLLVDNPILKENLKRHLSSINPDRMVIVSGVIYSKKTLKPLKNVDVGYAFNNNTKGTSTHNLTNQNGEFKMSTPKGNLFTIRSLSKNPVHFYPQKDTIVKLYL